MKEKLGCVTINTDASFFPIEKIGGYAFYIRYGDTIIRQGGSFHAPCNCSNEAEIMAIGNAFAKILSLRPIPKTFLVVVNTDSLTAIRRIKNPKTALQKKVRSLKDKMLHKMGKSDIVFRHVKAHSNKDDARSHVNAWCDKEAKKHAKLKKNGQQL